MSIAVGQEAMLFAQQLRAARTLLDWSQDTLAEKAGVGIATVKRIEAKTGPVGGQAETIWKLQTTLEKAGVIFIPDDGSHGAGVRLARTYTPE